MVYMLDEQVKPAESDKVEDVNPYSRILGKLQQLADEKKDKTESDSKSE